MHADLSQVLILFLYELSLSANLLLSYNKYLRWHTGDNVVTSLQSIIFITCMICLHNRRELEASVQSTIREYDSSMTSLQNTRDELVQQFGELTHKSRQQRVSC